MAVSVCGLLGQHVVRRVGRVPGLEAEPAITRLLLTEDRTALGTPLRRRVVNSHHALVRNIESCIWMLEFPFKVFDSQQKFRNSIGKLSAANVPLRAVSFFLLMTAAFFFSLSYHTQMKRSSRYHLLKLCLMRPIVTIFPDWFLPYMVKYLQLKYM